MENEALDNMPKEQLWWGYDFTCDQSVDGIFAAFKTASPWRWQLGDSDIYGDYVRCRPNENAEVRFELSPNLGDGRVRRQRLELAI